ncbi:MAG: hypothetical protein NT031_03125 [Planctomycetota bacterium]|nr:hypothetical protein [Planctomycetota bacterium]
MKSERRHELKQNDLDAELVKALGFFRTHGRLVGWVVLGLAAVALGYVLIQRHGESKELAAQDDFNKLVAGGEAKKDSLPRMNAIIDGDSNSFRAAYTCAAAGDMLVNSVLAGGADMTPQDRTEALDKGKEYYTKAIEKFSDQPGSAAKACLGLAVTAEQEKGLAAARRTLQQWEELASVGPMRQSPLTPPTTQPASLLPQAEMPFPDVPVPQGFRPESSAATTQPGLGAVRYVGEPSDIAVLNFYRAQMAQHGWKAALDRQQATFTLLMFTKGSQYLAAKIGRSGILNTEIELRSGSGATPPEFAPAPTTPATAPK